MKRKRKYLTLGPWYFQIKLVLTLVCLTSISILVYLGMWQLDRAMQKKYLHIQLQRRTDGMPVKLSSLEDLSLEKIRFMPIIASGIFLNQYTFLLDNQVHQGQAGYRVLTAFQSPYFANWLLVDRGWVPGGAKREILPEIKDIYGVKTITGVINVIPTGISLQADEHNFANKWPVVIQTLNFRFISEELHHEVYDFVVQLYANDPAAYTIPPIDFGAPRDKHLGYAMQWFSFAALVFIYYLIATVKRHK